MHIHLCVSEGQGTPAKSNTNNPPLLQVKRQPWRLGVWWPGCAQALQPAERRPLLAAWVTAEAGNKGSSIRGLSPRPGAKEAAVRESPHCGPHGAVLWGPLGQREEGTCKQHLQGVCPSHTGTAKAPAAEITSRGECCRAPLPQHWSLLPGLGTAGSWAGESPW